MYVALNLLIDILYGVIDPRVRIEHEQYRPAERTPRGGGRTQSCAQRRSKHRNGGAALASEASAQRGVSSEVRAHSTSETRVNALVNSP